jgi:hypothetical protein
VSFVGASLGLTDAINTQVFEQLLLFAQFGIDNCLGTIGTIGNLTSPLIAVVTDLTRLAYCAGGALFATTVNVCLAK